MSGNNTAFNIPSELHGLFVLSHEKEKRLSCLRVQGTEEIKELVHRMWAQKTHNR